MTEPETFINIPLSELKSWMKTLNEGAAPNVAYNPDALAMLKEAYVARGLAINSVAHSIYFYLP